MEFLSADEGPPRITDPIDWSVMNTFKRRDMRVRVGPDSNMQRLPFHVGLRAQGA